MEGQFQNTINDLPSLKAYRYENIFKLYTTENGQYYYNLLQSLALPDKINNDYIYYMPVTASIPWTVISYNAYKTTELWWLICLVNNITNPIKAPSEGTLVKVIKPQYIMSILSEIARALR
jgi:hypothetical protein